MPDLIKSIKVDTQRSNKFIDQDMLMTDQAYELVQSGLPFREAYLKVKSQRETSLVSKTLSRKNSDKNLHILADVKKEVKKTKEFNKFLEKNNLANALIISDTDSMKNINKSARNIKNIKLIKEEGTNIYDLFKYKNVIITSSSAKKIQERVLSEKD